MGKIMVNTWQTSWKKDEKGGKTMEKHGEHMQHIWEKDGKTMGEKAAILRMKPHAGKICKKNWERRKEPAKIWETARKLKMKSTTNHQWFVRD